MKTKGDAWRLRHRAVHSTERQMRDAAFRHEPPCFLRRKRPRNAEQDATSIRPLSRLL